MAESWYEIGGRVLSFRSRPISFIVETIDGSDFTLTLENGESGTYSSGGTSTILYSGTNSYPKFSFSNPLNIKRFETSDAIYIDNSQIGWLNIEILYCSGNSGGDFSDIGLLTSLTYLRLQGNSFTGDMSNVTNLTSLTYLRLIGNSFTGNMSGVTNLTSLTYLQLQGNFTINYTSTTFAPDFQRWSFRPTTATNPMSSSEIDQMLADAAQTTWTGDRGIYVDGNNGVRTSASDAYVATLQAMGVTLYLNV